VSSEFNELVTDRGEEHVSQVSDSFDKVPSPACDDDGGDEAEIAQRQQSRIQLLHCFTGSLATILTRVATITYNMTDVSRKGSPTISIVTGRRITGLPLIY